MIKKDPVSFTTLKKQVYSNLAALYKKKGEKEKADEYTKLTEGL